MYPCFYASEIEIEEKHTCILVHAQMVTYRLFDDVFFVKGVTVKEFMYS